jgi:ketosteroid isomerase-like protein
MMSRTLQTVVLTATMLLAMPATAFAQRPAPDSLNHAAATRYFAAYAAKRLDAMMAECTDNFAYVDETVKAVASRPFRQMGKYAVRRALTAQLAAIDSLRFEWSREFYAIDYGVLNGTMVMVQHGADGQRTEVSRPVVTILKFKGGKLRSQTDYVHYQGEHTLGASAAGAP